MAAITKCSVSSMIPSSRMNKLSLIIWASLAGTHLMAAEPVKWSDPFCNYRLRLDLSEGVSGAREVKVPISEIIEALRPLSPELLD